MIQYQIEWSECVSSIAYVSSLDNLSYQEVCQLPFDMLQQLSQMGGSRSELFDLQYSPPSKLVVYSYSQHDMLFITW